MGLDTAQPAPARPHQGVNIAPALAVRGVFAVLTHEDVPGRKTYGLEIPDQPVLAWDQVRYQGEPIAIVAADHPETARYAASQIEVDFEVLEPVTDMEAAFDAEPLHPSGNLLRHVRIEHGDPEATADVVVSGDYEVGMQDQAFLGPESGLAVIPAEDGGVDLFISTQWLHVDRDQVAASLDLPPDKVRISLAGARRRVRRARGPLDAGARVPARAPHRQAGEDDVRARGVVLRPHPSPPRADALRARGDARRAADLHQVPNRARRRRVCLELDRRCARTRPRSRAARTTCRTR